MPDKVRKTPSVTTETEYGYFIRKKIRHGKKRTQKTDRLKNNPEKVIIDRIGDLEIYCYPYNFPDKIFIGLYPLSTSLEIEDFNRLFGIMNKIRWYLQDEWVKSPKNEKGAKYLRKRIVKAYNYGLEQMKKRKNDSFSR